MDGILECQNCNNSTTIRVTLCHRCCTQLTKSLKHVTVNMSKLLDETIKRMDSTVSVSEPVRGGDDSFSEPTNRRAADVAEEFKETLWSWREYLQERLRPDSTAVSQPAIAFLSDSTWLMEHTDVIRIDELSGEIYQQIMDGCRQVERVVDLPPDRLTMGGCGADSGYGGECDGTLRGIVGHRTVRCDTCGATYLQDDVRSLKVSAAHDEPRSLATVVKMLNLAGARLRYDTAKKWAQRGHLEPDHIDEGGRKYYTLATVQDTYAQRISAA